MPTTTLLQPVGNFDNGKLQITEDTPLLSGPQCERLRQPSYSLTKQPGVEHNFVRDTDCKSSPRTSPLNSFTVADCFDAAPCCSTISETCNPPESTSTPQGNIVHNRWSFLPDGIELRLENSGSVARDHLASERTFLAYIRTSLALTSAGVALVQLLSVAGSSAGSVHRLNRCIKPLGASAVIIGMTILIIGVMRYFQVQAALTKGYFPVARVATGFIAVMLTALVALTFGVLMAGK